MARWTVDAVSALHHMISRLRQAQLMVVAAHVTINALDEGQELERQTINRRWHD